MWNIVQNKKPSLGPKSQYTKTTKELTRKGYNPKTKEMYISTNKGL